MRLLILSRSASIYSTRRLVETARARGHRVRVVDPARCVLLMAGAATHLYYRRHRVAQVDAVIPRIAESLTHYGLAVLEHFSLRGVPVLNDTAAVAQARNKLRCLLALASHGIPVPATVMARDAAEIKEMIDLVGGVPVLVKILRAGERAGVMVCESVQSMNAALEAVLGLGHHLLVQQYVRGPGGKDIRALVVGDRVVAAVRRRARSGRMSRTLGRGARFETTRLSEKQERLALESARVIGLKVAAIDMFEVLGETRVFEVNASPGLKDLEAVSGKDLATPIIELAERRAKALRPLGPTVTSARRPPLSSSRG
ncbi:MAG: ATP-grasp domain-containing protein [Deltaproteobacteria bacterium]